MSHVSPPTFSGEQKDYQAFWSEFKVIHDTTKYTDSNKLVYLRQAQKNPELRRQISQNIDNGDKYADVIAGFQQQFDRPREMHKIYVNQLMQIGQVKPTRSSIMSCATTLKSSMDGLIRLKQWDAASIYTSIVEDLLPEKLRIRWEDETITSKTVPPVEQMIAFLRTRAAQPQYAEKASANPSSEKKPFSRQKASGHTGSVHVASSQSNQTSSQQPEPQAPRPAAAGKSQYNKSKSSLYAPCRYTCPECSEAHYAYGCDLFKEKTTSQRKEFVQAHSLCSRCLKPEHSLQDCTNRYNCRICDGSHHVMLHTPERNHSSTPVSTGTVNTTCTTSSDSSFTKNKLMMTCEAEATGPTGKTMRVRALLDSGADVSSVTTKVAHLLNLKHLDTSVTVATFGSTKEQVCRAANFSLSSVHRKDWSHQVSAVIVDKITDNQPKQDASQVKNMVAVQGLTPADSQFHRPGRIDVLSGADVLPYVQTRSGPESSIMAVDTVFGHAFMGTYQSTAPEKPITANIQLASNQSVTTSDDSLSQAINKFWEVEEPPMEKQAFTAEEKRVQSEYALNHTFNPTVGKYEVVLPRKPEDLKLGESKSRALQRYYSNERALQRKGTWAKFQQVVQEYLDLDHARLCTPEELLLPASEAYYLPMHSVSKVSSSTTKL